MQEDLIEQNLKNDAGPFAFIFDIAQTVFIALGLTAIIYLFIATPHQVEGKSMEVNFHNGELILSNKVIQLVGDRALGDRLNYDYERGDVVIFRQDGKEDFIKRIIAVENDRIKIEDGKIFVNGNELNEQYIPNEPGFKTKLPSVEYAFLTEAQEKTVPAGKYFVMGDNREHSLDSRYSAVGWVDRSEIKGKVFVRYWPLSEFGLIPRGEYSEQ